MQSVESGWYFVGSEYTQNATKITDKKWIVNMSSTKWTYFENGLLAKDVLFNFSITSKALPNKYVIATIEDTVNDLE